MNKEPCSICEEYIEGVVCDKDKCPVAQLKNNFEKALKTIDGLMAGQKTLIEEAKTAKSEAIRKFAERLKETSEHFDVEKENFVSEEAIDNLIKEMVGDE